MTNNPNPKSSNPFINECSNIKSIINDHEASVCPQSVQQLRFSKNMSGTKLLRTDAGRALSALRQADRDRLITPIENSSFFSRSDRNYFGPMKYVF